MRPEDIRALLDRRPFQPFRITLTDGRTYDVRHPELAAVGRSVLFIGFAAAGEKEPVFDRFTWVSLLHIMQVEPIDGEAPRTPSSSS